MIGWNTQRSLAIVFTVVALAFDTMAYADGMPIELMIDNGNQLFRFQVELARTQLEKREGLQGMRTMADDDGMLFLFDPPAKTSIWMKRTYIPLDILFIDSDGSIQKIVEEAQPHSTIPMKSEHPVSAVLELKGGTSRRLGLRTGNRVTIF